MLRWFNMGEAPAELTLQSKLSGAQAYKTTILEETGDLQPFNDRGEFSLSVKPYEILTIGVKA